MNAALAVPAGARAPVPVALAAPPLALYVHLPWCRRKCPYCDFNSHALGAEAPPAPRYAAALLADLARDAPLVGGRTVETVFFGGGTPSLFEPAAIADLLAGIRARVAVAADAEITLEANPGTLECGRFLGYREAGVTRFSLGAQSFAARQLERLGRIHGPAEIYSAVAELREAGVENFNLDLMYALPEQALVDAVADIDAALSLAPPHLSYYELTLEPGTAFHRRPPPLPDDATAAAVETPAQARLETGGYERYEISAWARPGARCRHNLNYWEYGDYLGIGAGAHGKLTDVATQRILRSEKPRLPESYMKSAADAAGATAPRPVPAAERPFEFMLNALRLRAGFQIPQFEARTGLAFSAIEATVETQLRRGLLAAAGTRIAPTELGWRFLNDLQLAYLAPPQR